MLAVTLVFDPLTPLIFLIIALLTLSLLVGVRVGNLLKAIAPFLLIAFGFFLTNALFYDISRETNPTVLFSGGPVTLSLQGILVGTSIGLRVLCIVAYSLIFVMTTDPTELIISLIKQCRVNPRIGYGALAGYRFLPLLYYEYENLSAAHRIRGFKEVRGIRGAYRRLKRYAIPLLVSAVRKAERVAIAMDSKAFGAYPTRTYRRDVRVREIDWVVLITALVGTAAIILALWKLGTLRWLSGSLS